MSWAIFFSGLCLGLLAGMAITAVLVVASRDSEAIPSLPETDDLNRNPMSIEQISIALAKLYNGTVPGDENWDALDHEALEYATGHPVAFTLKDDAALSSAKLNLAIAKLEKANAEINQLTGEQSHG